ncbi:MAG: putative ATP-binding protein [Ilumatobacteraceae bacterium]|jgi:tRNA threonylcarbamoyladenosine biosynthesis protein TsaE|nr:putative ATP-binding protein [Ilumatobacteraceae bacterium]
MLQVRTRSLAQTHAVAAAIARLSRSGDLLVLAGEMGAGKTAFAQGFGAALGVTEPITSPTFNLVHSYPAGRITLHHADVYRLTTQNEVADLALGELAEDRGIVLVEWGDVVAAVLGDHLAIRLEAVPDDVPETDETDEGGDADATASVGEPVGEAAASDPDEIVDEPRALTITGVGRGWATRWSALEAALGEWAAC